MQTSSYILSGPKETTKIPKQTLGRLIFDCLKKRPYNDEINVSNFLNKFEILIAKY